MKVSTIVLISTLSVFSFLAVVSEAQAAAPAGFAVETVAGGFTRITSGAFLPDGRALVAEKAGTVHIVDGTTVLPAPMLTIPNVNTHGDRGLLGIAVDPNYQQNGYLYVAYTHEHNASDPEGAKTGRIARVQIVNDVADMNTFTTILGTVSGTTANPSCDDFLVTDDCIPSDSASHSVGGLRFGADGHLYATLGDGAGFFEVEQQAHRALDLDSLGGKLVRITTDGTAASGNPYHTGNPNDNRSKVYAYGLRNSFTFNIRPENGSVYMGDVGWDTWEEVNVAKGVGENFGWPCREGDEPQARYNCTTTNYVDPIHQYPHPSGQSSAIVGGAFAGAAYPAEFQGDYFFADVVEGTIQRLVVDANDEVVSHDPAFLPGSEGPVEFITGPDGAIYFLSIFTGELRKLTYDNSGGSGSGPADPVLESATLDTTDPTVDSPVSFTLATKNNGGTDPFIISVEMYDEAGDLVEFLYRENETIAAGDTEEHTFTWTPTATGDYRLEVGYFGEDWSPLYSWFSDPLPITVVEDNSSGGNNEPARPFLLEAQVQSADPVPNQPVSFTLTTKNNGEFEPFLISAEIYDQAGNFVTEMNEDNILIETGDTIEHTFAWTPTETGTYTIEVGYFEAGWNGFLGWHTDALTIAVGTGGGIGTGEPEPFFIETTTDAPERPVFARPINVTAEVGNDGGTDPFIINVEIYDSAGALEQHAYFENQSVPNGETASVTFEWFPTKADTFSISVGTFSPDWETMYEWVNETASIEVFDRT